MSARKQLINYIRTHISERYEEDQDLIDFLDSVSALQLLMFIEQNLGAEINPNDFDAEMLLTLDTLIEALGLESEKSVDA
jgi:acyl carrier protein